MSFDKGRLFPPLRAEPTSTVTSAASYFISINLVKLINVSYTR